jgi:hypothetical protein
LCVKLTEDDDLVCKTNWRWWLVCETNWRWWLVWN